MEAIIIIGILVIWIFGVEFRLNLRTDEAKECLDHRLELSRRISKLERECTND